MRQSERYYIFDISVPIGEEDKYRPGDHYEGPSRSDSSVSGTVITDLLPPSTFTPTDIAGYRKVCANRSINDCRQCFSGLKDICKAPLTPNIT